MEVKTEEGVGELVVPVSSLQVTPSATEVFENVQKLRFPICTVHNIDLRHLLDQHKLFHDASLVENFDLLLKDSLYKVHLVGQDDSSGKRSSDFALFG